jgi:hypothetical protein
MGNITIDPGPRGSEQGAGLPVAEPHLGWIVAGCCAAAAAIHFAMVPIHAGSGLTDPLGFAITGWFQLAVAAVILSGRGTKTTYTVAALGNLFIIGMWAASRTVGLPVGAHKGIVEPVAAIDLTCAILEGVAVVVAVRVLLAGEGRSRRLAPALAAVAALGLATTVISSPDASTHGSTKSVDALTAAQQKIDATRCDKSFNIPAYWKEAKALGIDTDWGGQTPPVASSTSAAPVNESQPHVHGAGGASAAPASGPTTTTQPDPTEGRGSQTLDRLIADTFNASGGEEAAAGLVNDLSASTNQDYKDWLWWLKASGNTAHYHPSTIESTTATGASGDGGGHGGHVGPQLWTAMTDQKQCDQLASELKEARDVALKYNTVTKAEAAGWHQVTPYVPGIAAHYMNFKLVDDKFEIAKPEMLLFDGTLPDSHIVGLSYYLYHDGDLEPTQGFTGQNDHGHRHVGLCIGKGGVIGDSTLTAAECEAIGGTKAQGSKEWMYHAWVVPGCESPWGVFSAASPVLDSGVTNSGPDDGGHCAGSQVRARYGMGKDGSTKKLTIQPIRRDRGERRSDSSENASGDTTPAKSGSQSLRGN